MSTENDVARSLRSWLRENRHEDADRVLEAVFDQVPATRQRSAPWLARRFPIMNNTLRIGLVAAAALVVAVIGIQLLGGPNVGGPSNEPSPSATQTQQSTATPAASVGDVTPAAGPLEPGTRYAVRRGDVALTFAVPTPGWNIDSGGWITGNPGTPQIAHLYFLESTGVPGIFTDPCAHTGLQQFDSSAAGEVEAMASQVGADLVSPTHDITIDGRAGRMVAISIPQDVGCPNSDYWLQYDPDCGAVLECTSYPWWLGSTIRTWAVDLDGGTRLRIGIETQSSNAEFEAELQQIVDSIQFE
jgi:hypothetical protein